MVSIHCVSIRDLVDEQFRGTIPANLTYEEFYRIAEEGILPPGFEVLESVKEKENFPNIEEKKVELKEKASIFEEMKEKTVKEEEKKEKVKDEKKKEKVKDEEKKEKIVKEEEKKEKMGKGKEKERKNETEADVRADLKLGGVEQDEWVTVKTRSKKKGEGDSTKPEPKSEQLDVQASNKNKKKALKKRLKEVKELIKKQSEGQKLNPHQLQKIQNKDSLEKEIASLS